MKKQYDVIIVGCGVAGCFAALQLPKEKEKFEKFIKEKENSILKKAKYIEKEILKNEQE